MKISLESSDSRTNMNYTTAFQTQTGIPLICIFWKLRSNPYETVVQKHAENQHENLELNNTAIKISWKITFETETPATNFDTSIKDQMK